ncbi:tetratricopeptide repeat protein [Propionispira raffinosivorans]|uniref:tetratricopeptide repeat protein n=1 Tax=Propionispira raffinosivorans TaxID=86959 RepID=UPI0003779286|nr:CDC27 family protein [Propionispira raffinosivorans]
MGKASKKLAKNQKKNKLVELKAKITEYKEAGNVKDALDIVIELFNLKCYDVEVLFDAAELYFLDGDYDRAAVWANKTMEFEGGHIGARILLSRICFLKNRPKDGLAVLEFILNTTQHLTDQQAEQIQEILESLESSTSELCAEYPHITEFMNNLKTAEVLPGLNQSEEHIHLKKNVTVDQEAETVKEVVSVQTLKMKIANKKVSLQEKITLYNSSAGQAYYEDQLGDAEILLLAALELDEYNVESLRNMVLLAVAAHDTIGALQYAAKLPTTDFALLKLIKDHV